MWNDALTAEEIDKIYQDGLKGISIGGLPRGPSLKVGRSQDGMQLVLSWDSKDGKLYNLRSETDLSNGDPIDWPLVGTHEEIVATQPMNVLAIPFPAEEERYFVIEEFNAPPVTIFFDDFENGPGAWETGSEGAAGTAWELGTPSAVGPAAANSPTNCFATNLASGYAIDAKVWLRSPVIDLTTAGGATLNYFNVTDIEPGFDFGRIAILDAADGSEIVELANPIDGVDTLWREATHVLPAEALGKIIRIEFRFSSEELENFSGWYLDDVRVTVP